MRYILFGLTLTALSGCSTMYFEKGKTEDLNVDYSNWHHGGGIFALFEFSDPFNPSKACAKDSWTAVKVEHSFPSALVSVVVPYGIYSPWEVSARCSKQKN